jgi:hypothetical protein
VFIAIIQLGNGYLKGSHCKTFIQLAQASLQQRKLATIIISLLCGEYHLYKLCKDFGLPGFPY